MAAPAAKLLIDLAANVAGLRKDFSDATQVVQKFGSDVEHIGRVVKEALGFVGLGASLEGIRELIKSVGDLGEMADSVALTTDQFQAFSTALTQAGVHADQTSQLLGKAAKFVGEALQGGKQQIEFFNDLNVKLLDAKGNAIEMATVMQLTAQAILKVEDPAKRVALAAQFMGKSGKEAIPALRELATGAEALRQQYDAAIIPQETIERLDKVADRSDLFYRQVRAVAAIQIGNLFTPDFYESMDRIGKAIEDIGKTIRSIQGINGGKSPFADWDAEVKATAEEFEFMARAIKVVVDAINQVISAAKLVPYAISTMVAEVKAGIAKTFGSAEDAAKAQAAVAAARYAEQGRVISHMLGTPGEDTAPPTREGLVFGPPAPNVPAGGTQQPAIKTTGVDKYAEALKKLRAEIDAVNAGVDQLTKSTNLPSKEAERQAQATIEAGQKLAAMLKDLPAGTDDTKIRALVDEWKKAKLAFDELKQTIATADTVNAKYGDGVKELADKMFYLNKALADGRITTKEAEAATKDYQLTAAKQKEINAGLGEGAEQVAAGWKYAALSLEQTNQSFQIGQQLFTNSLNIMSSAISEFVQTGTLDFAKLAKSFAAMLADMAAQLVAKQILTSILGSFGGGKVDPMTGAAAGGTGLFGWLGGLFSGGARAAGGDVSPGNYYTVGESGPERFVPKVPGTIVPANAGNTGSVTVNIDMNQTQGAKDPASALEFGRKVKAAVVDVITNEKRPGGTLYARHA